MTSRRRSFQRRDDMRAVASRLDIAETEPDRFPMPVPALDLAAEWVAAHPGELPPAFAPLLLNVSDQVAEVVRSLAWALYWIQTHAIVPDPETESDEQEHWHQARRIVKRADAMYR